ncbi:MAG: hypothetical protein RJQ00_02675 [Vicingaceae bacterium]
MQKFARFVSYVFHPIFAPLISLYILFQLPLLQNYRLTEFYKQYIYGAMLINLVIVPLLMSFYFKRIGIIKSLEMKTLEERRTPYLMSLIFYFFTLLLLYYTKFPIVYVKAFLGATLVVGALYLFTFLKLKVSAHLSGIGGICGLLFVLSNIYMVELTNLLLLFIVLSGVVATARMTLKAHSYWELSLGFLLGFFSAFMVYLPWF